MSVNQAKREQHIKVIITGILKSVKYDPHTRIKSKISKQFDPQEKRVDRGHYITQENVHEHIDHWLVFIDVCDGCFPTIFI